MSLHWIVLCPQMAKNSHQKITLLSMKQGSLFCFVLSHWDLPNHSVSCWALGIFSCWVWVHWLGLRLFGAKMWKLLIIEPSSQWNLKIKPKLKTVLKFGSVSWCCWKAFDESDLIEFISQFSKVKCGRYIDFWVGFCFKQIVKNWVWKEKSVEPSMCSHLGQQHRLH
jgi:hypothetical protein